LHVLIREKLFHGITFLHDTKENARQSKKTGKFSIRVIPKAHRNQKVQPVEPRHNLRQTSPQNLPSGKLSVASVSKGVEQEMGLSVSIGSAILLFYPKKVH
jgi:hypothetical protein